MTPVNPSDISVVICAYSLDRWAMLAAAVESATDGQSHSPREVVLVVDFNPELLERAVTAFPSIRVIPNDGPRGLSGARNTGLRAAVGAVVAFLDDDAVADGAWLATLAEGYTSERVQGVGGSAEATWETGRPRWFPAEFEWVVGCSYRGLPSVRAPVRNPLGCNMSFRRETLERLGGFRSEVGRIGARPTGGDETELCIRLHTVWPDGLVLYDPEARIRHHVPASRASWTYFRSRCFSEGVSKAIVSRMAGATPALSVERAYVRRVLPAGVKDGLLDVLRGRPAGLARACAIVLGLAVTTAGYAYGMATRAALQRAEA